jgi:hypothetical protein
MKKLMALSLAAVVTATSIATTMTSASAGDRDYGRHRPYIMHRQNDNIAPFLFGSIFGSIFGSMLSQPYYSQQPYYGQRYTYYRSNPHVEWCLARYKTYNPATNTFFIRRGVQAVCVSPYYPY